MRPSRLLLLATNSPLARRVLYLAIALVLVIGLIAPAWGPASAGLPVRADSLTGGVHLDAPYPPTPGPLQIFGISARGEWGSAGARQMAIDAGVIWVRTAVSWASLEPTRGAINLSSLDDGFLQFQQLGVIPIVIILDNPTWAADSNCGPLKSGMASEFGLFVSALAQRYNGTTVVNGVTLPRIDYWQLYNEPDIQWTTGSAATFGGCWGKAGSQYAQLLAVAWTAAHAANTHAQIVFGGVAAEDISCPWAECSGQPLFNFNINGGDFVDDVFAYMQNNPGSTYFDLFDFHNYAGFHWRWDPYGPGLTGKASYYKTRMSNHGFSRPVVCTEAGRRSDSGQSVDGVPGSDEEQSRYVVRLFVQAMKAGLRALTWFTFSDDVIPSQGGAVAWGLLSQPNYAPKPSYNAFRTLTQQLGAVSSVASLSLGSSAEGYVFDVPVVGKRSVIWATGASAVNVSFPVSAIHTTDKWGSVNVIHDGQAGDQDGAVNGTIVLSITGSPLYIDGQPGVTSTRPIADFSGAPLQGHPPLLVQFTNNSLGSSPIYAWTFGDGATSADTNPSHMYTTAGSYTVTLTVANGLGSDTLIRTNYIQPYTFDDVPPSNPQWLYVETIYAHGITAGCSTNPPLYCPTGLVKREEIAVFLDRALGWPPKSTYQGYFADLPQGYWATPFAETLFEHGLTAGCGWNAQGKLLYCPSDQLTKAQIATMIRAGNGWPPVNPPQGIFADVPLGGWQAPHVEAFYNHSPGTACSYDATAQKPNFCPDSYVNRAYMAELLVKGFGL